MALPRNFLCGKLHTEGSCSEAAEGFLQNPEAGHCLGGGGDFPGFSQQRQSFGNLYRGLSGVGVTQCAMDS